MNMIYYTKNKENTNFSSEAHEKQNAITVAMISVKQFNRNNVLIRSYNFGKDFNKKA